MQLKLIFSIFLLLPNPYNCYNFDLNIYQYFTSSLNYYGYSLLLQKGNPSYLIIGAPKANFYGIVYRCIIGKSNCEKYSLPKDNFGEFRGAVLDGDNITGGVIFVSAPRFTLNYDSDNIFMNGKCIVIKNSSILNNLDRSFLPTANYKQLRTFNRINFYDAAFAEAGIDLKYNKEDKELLFGAPGMLQWNGAIIRVQLFNWVQRDNVLLPTKHQPNTEYSHYFGYSVASGRFLNKIWYIAGVPRGNNLTGLVIVFEYTKKSFEKILIKSELVGEELGSYFGAVVLVIKNYLLISAPTYTGLNSNGWDRGCVYIYKFINNEGIFELSSKLLGSQKSAGRFGTTMVDLGDIDLDSYNDVAIAAPYDYDDGDNSGAVYIYMGTKTGFQSQYSQRITPSSLHRGDKFMNRGVIGFGLGLSKGLDINKDDHNDLAIGAYKSRQVFLIRTVPVVDQFISLMSNFDTLTLTSNNLTLKFCIIQKLRNNNFAIIPTRVRIILDRRALIEKNITKIYHIRVNETFCSKIFVPIKPSILNVDPFVSTMTSNIVDKSVILGKSENINSEIAIPFSNGCGSDGICQIELILNASINLKSIILGHHNELEIFAFVDNLGEPAYQVEFHLTIPENIDIINLRECHLNHKTYICLIDEILIGKTPMKRFLLDISHIKENLEYLKITLQVKSFGIDLNQENNEIHWDIPIVFQNNPYIEGKSDQKGLIVVDTNGNIKEKIILQHKFAVGNTGPSPFEFNLNIFLPNINQDNNDIIEIKGANGLINNKLVECNFDNIDNITTQYYKNDGFNKSILNRTIFIKCHKDCLKLSCKSDQFLFKSSKTVDFSLKLLIDPKLIARKYYQDLLHKDIIMFVTSADLFNGTHWFHADSYTPLYGFPIIKSIPLWVYGLSIPLGLILFLFLTYLLYKCNFFKRTYKDKLDNEGNSTQILQNDAEN